MDKKEFNIQKAVGALENFEVYITAPVTGTRTFLINVINATNKDDAIISAKDRLNRGSYNDVTDDKTEIFDEGSGAVWVVETRKTN